MLSYFLSYFGLILSSHHCFIPRRESKAQVILTLNHCAKEHYCVYSDHLTEFCPSRRRCLHCTATIKQLRISFRIITVRIIFLSASVSVNIQGLIQVKLEALFFIFALRSTSSRHGRALVTFYKDSFTRYIFFSRYPT